MMKYKRLIKAVVLVVIWCVALSAGYTFMHALATAERGYEAIGGELFVWIVPLFYWIIKECIRECRENAKNRRVTDGSTCQDNNQVEESRTGGAHE